MPDGAGGGGFEVISLVRRHRHWTAERKLALVEEAGRPGLSLAAVADRYGGKPEPAVRLAAPAARRTMPGVAAAAPAPVPGFAPVRLIEDASAAPALAVAQPRPLPRQARQQAPSTIELVLCNGRC